MSVFRTTYGFFDPFTLSVYLDLSSPYHDIRDKFFDGSIFNSGQRTDGFSLEKKVDYLFRLGSVFHERQHFHDFISTAYGARIFNQCLKTSLYAILLLSELTDAARSGKRRFYLPLTSTDLTTSSLPHLYREKYQLDALVDSARCAFEASAVFTQMALIHDLFFDIEPELILECINSHIYTDIITSINFIGHDLPTLWYDVGGYLGEIIRILVLISLSEIDQQSSPDSFITTAIPHFAAKIKQISTNLQTRNREINDLLATLRDKLARTQFISANDHVQQEVNNTISLISRAVPDPALRDDLCNVAIEFRDVSQAARNAILARDNLYCDQLGLLSPDANLVEPLFFQYATQEKYSFAHAPYVRDDPYPNAYKIYNTQNGELFVPVIERLPPLTQGHSLSPHFLKIMSEIAGAVGLISELDWKNPITAPFLRKLQNTLGIRFYAR